MPKTPSYRQRPGYSQALVTLTDARTKRRRDYWLGEFGSPQSRELYHRLIAEWESNDRRLPETAQHRAPRFGDARDEDDGDGPTVREVIGQYWRWANKYYQPNESGTLKVALRLLRQFYGSTLASRFGPKRLRVLRESMICGDASAERPRKPWSRIYINQQTRRIRQMFRWAASHELIPASVAQALATVEPLKRGRTAAREGKRVRPVDEEMIAAIKPFVSRQVWALVQLQLVTGARSGELLPMRMIDIDTSDPSGVWAYRPIEHKNAFRGKDRVIYLGPAAKRIIEPFMTDRSVDACLFSAAEAEAERRAELHARRRTPLSCGNRPGTNRREQPQHTVGDCYTTPSYYRAIQRACDLAFPHPDPVFRPREIVAAPVRNGTKPRKRLETAREVDARLSKQQREALDEWRRRHRWHPHRLRHNAGTAIRRAFGLEAAQLVLGHSSAQITDAVYADRDHTKVVEIMKRIG